MAWRLPENFDGAAFRERYNLGEWDYFARDGMLVLRDGITLPDNPPIMEVVDAVNREKKRIDAFATSNDPQAKSIRGLARVVLASVSNVIAKHNSLLAILASGRFPTQQEATALTIPVRNFATLMASVKQAAINEVDPNA